MSFANEELYKGYMRTNMPRIVTTVKPREIIIHLPCLTDHDREQIEAKNDMSGSYEAMKVLLTCMKRRESWPEQFIKALEACEHRMIAAEIRAEYNRLRGINNNPSPPPPTPPVANVVTAHVHPAPSVPHLSDPGPAACALPSRDVPPEPRQTNPIQETETPTKTVQAQPEPPVVEVTTPPEPLQIQAEPLIPAAVPPPATPPPSPKSIRDSTNPSPVPEQDIIPRQEPEENLEPDIVQAQEVPNGRVNVPQEVEEIMEVPPAAEHQEEPCETGDSMETTTIVDQPPSVLFIEQKNTPSIENIIEPILVEPEPVTVTTEQPALYTTTDEEETLTAPMEDNLIVLPVSVEDSPARSTSPMTSLDDLILTPEKPPVQETRPREEKVTGVVPVTEETPEPQNTQVVEIIQEIEAAPTPPAEVGEISEINQRFTSENEDIIFSKPGVLMSVEPPDQNNTTMCPPSPDPTPYSGDSGRLEMSEDVKSAPSCLENGINHKEPDKDVCESPAPSLEEEDVGENVVQVAEDPSILNKETEMPLMEEPTKESATPLISVPSCCTNAGDLSEPPAPSLDEEDIEENCTHVLEQSSILNHEIQKPLIEQTEEQPVGVTIPSTTIIPDTSFCSNEEEISKSPAPSLDMEDVRENVGHVAEEPSLLNLDVQTPLLQINGEPTNETATATGISDAASITNFQTPIVQVNGEPPKEITPVPPKLAPATNDNHPPNDPNVDQKLPDSGNSATSRPNARYILTAAGVGACALLIAWRLKH